MKRPNMDKYAQARRLFATHATGITTLMCIGKVLGIISVPWWYVTILLWLPPMLVLATAGVILFVSMVVWLVAKLVLKSLGL